MLTIKRTCANKIITRVLAAGDKPFIAVLPPNGDDCIVKNDQQSLQAFISHYPGASVIYNQHPQAQTKVNSLNADNQQIIIEVRQETRGVLGLQARFPGSAPEDFIELVFQENS